MVRLIRFCFAVLRYTRVAAMISSKMAIEIVEIVNSLQSRDQVFRCSSLDFK